MIEWIKKKHVLVAFAALIGVEAAGAWWEYCRAVVEIRNESGQDISGIRIAVRDDKHEIEHMAVGSSRRIRVFPAGESGVALSFKMAEGKPVNWEGGYIEATGGYRMRVTIRPGGDISEKTHLRRGLLLGRAVASLMTSGRNR